MKKLSSEYIRDIDAKSRRSNFCIKVQVCDPAILKGQAATTGQLLTNDGYKNRQQYKTIQFDIGVYT